MTITGEVRFSYLHVWTPGETPSGDMKYSASLLIPKEDVKTLTAIDNAIQAAIKKGLELGKFQKVHVKGLRLPLRDGDAEIEQGKKDKNYAGFFFLNASSKNQPGLVDEGRKPFMDEKDMYSGAWGHADIQFFPYNTAGNRGIGVGLGNLMKTRNDERLDGRLSADQAFSEIPVVEMDESEEADMQ